MSNGGKMKKVFFVLLLFMAGFVFSLGAAETVDVSKYALGPSDLLEISVWNHPDLKTTVNVRPDGWITYPLIGEVYVSGYNPAELTETIRRRLSKYVRNPVVSISVLEYRSKKILVIGEVKTPGIYQYEGNLSVFNAIGLAGGYNKHAELKSVLVVRNASYKRDSPDFQIVNLHRLIRNADVSGNIRLVPGDIVYVPQNVIGNVGDFMDYFLSRIQPAAETYGFIKR